MNYSAVIFDLDGTLLDTLDDISAAANEAIAAEGFPPHSLSDYRRFIGDGVATLMTRALPPGAVNDLLVERCVDRFRVSYARLWRQATRPYDGIEELLSALHERGVPQAILSNKPHDATVRCVDHFFPGHPFASVFGQRASVPKKPHPQAAREIVEKLRLTPRQVVYVGDTSTDMQTAVAAELFAVGVLWGFREREELLASGAHAIIAQPRELLDFF
jgi:phosphoglycolate phosphatase